MPEEPATPGATQGLSTVAILAMSHNPKAHEDIISAPLFELVDRAFHLAAEPAVCRPAVHSFQGHQITKALQPCPGDGAGAAQKPPLTLLLLGAPANAFVDLPQALLAYPPLQTIVSGPACGR